jgi:hypothetical protein
MEVPFQIRPARLQDAAIIAEYNRALARETEGRDLDPDRIGPGVVAAGRFPPGISSLCNGLVLQRSYAGPSTNEALRARTEPASTPLKSTRPPTLD